LKFQRTDVNVPESLPGTPVNQERIRGGVRRGRSERVEAEESDTMVVKGLEDGAGSRKVVTGTAGLGTEAMGQEEQGAGTIGEWQGFVVSPQQQDLTGPACTGTGRPEKRKPVRAIPMKINLMGIR
jgi:hypothetical protein